MKIKMLWGQRKCAYPGQYAPELIQCVDENTDDENPDVLQDAYDEAVISDDYDALRFITANVRDIILDKIMKSEHHLTLYEVVGD
jgi:hypothetical protein